MVWTGAGIWVIYDRSFSSGPRMLPMNTAGRQPYPSDLTDAEWVIIEPLLPPPLPAVPLGKSTFNR